MLKCSGCREPVPSWGQHCNLGDPEGVGHPSRHHCICSGTDTLRVSDTLHYVYRAKIFANSHFLIHLDSHLEHGIFVDWSATSAQVQKRAVFVVVENAGNIVPNDHIINIHCTSIEFTSIPLTYYEIQPSKVVVRLFFPAFSLFFFSQLTFCYSPFPCSPFPYSLIENLSHLYNVQCIM